MSAGIGFTQLPNLVWDRNDLTVYERVVLVHIIRKTIGWGKKSDGISLSQFSNDLGMSKNTAIKAIKKLINLEVISCVGSKNNNGSQGFNSYEISGKIVNTVNGCGAGDEQGVVQEMNRGSAGDEQGVVQEMNRGSAGDEQGVVQEMNRGSAGDEHTKETNTKETNTKEKEKETKRKNDNGGRAKSKVLIRRDWQPSDRCKELIARAGISSEFASGLVDEFVLYWEERGERRAGWDSTFLNHIKRNFKNGGDGDAGAVGSGKTFAEKYGHIEGISA